MTGRHGCTKRPYPTRTAALRALGSLARKHRDEAHTYRCPRCTRWHLTSQTRRRDR